MAENVIYVRGSRAEARRVIVAALNQRGSESAKVMMVRMGLAALANIKRAFVVKARGGTDDCGLSWPPLKKSTIAYSRRHPGVPKSSIRANFAPSWSLTKKQRERWWALYRSFLGKAPMGAAYHAKGAQRGSGWAAARAWQVLKAEGARTLMMRFGDTQVEILRDTGLLLNSLSPGIDPESASSNPPLIENQVFRVGDGEVIIGTNRKWAGLHHTGGSRTPQRRLWANPSQWPNSWWEPIVEQGRAGLIDILLAELR